MDKRKRAAMDREALASVLLSQRETRDEIYRLSRHLAWLEENEKHIRSLIAETPNED
jgi:hypothetical protein